jgi:hypothetical protein
VAPFVVMAAIGCSSVKNTVRTTEQLEVHATDPTIDADERHRAMSELLERRDRPIASELVRISERRLHEARVTQDKQVAAGLKTVGLEVVDALRALGDRSTSVLTMRLGDAESEICDSKDALEILAQHEDPVVRDLAKARLRR